MAQIQTKFIANNAVTNAKLAQAPSFTLKGNNTGSTANEQDLTVAQVQAMLSVPTSSSPLAIGSGGTGQTTANAAFDALSPMTTAGDIIYENATPTAARLAIGTSGQVLTVVSGLPAWSTPTSGTVTSVALLDGSSTPIYNISGSPVTSSGTLDFTLKTQSANTVFAGPTTGSAAQPAFRALVAADIPSLSGTYVPQSEVGAANGVASLDSGGKVPLSQLPATLMEFQGSWDPATNTPTLVDGTGVTGYTYWVNTAFAGPVAGLSNASMYNFQIGDLVIYNGTQWVLVTPAAGVQSVNGAQGAVTVNAINQLTGDVTTSAASGSQSEVATLVATSNATLTTLSALTTASSLSSVGTITSGTWNGTTIAIAYGGTGATTATTAFNNLNPMTTTGDTIYEASAGVAARLPIGTSGQILTVSGGIPTWATAAATSVATEDVLTLNSTDITNQYKDLLNPATGSSSSTNSVELGVYGGPEQLKGTDYTVSLTGGVAGVTRITFAGDLASGGGAALISGDILMVSYTYA